jgi:hypothetical protein
VINIGDPLILAPMSLLGFALAAATAASLVAGERLPTALARVVPIEDWYYASRLRVFGIGVSIVFAAICQVPIVQRLLSGSSDFLGALLLVGELVLALAWLGYLATEVRNSRRRRTRRL